MARVSSPTGKPPPSNERSPNNYLLFANAPLRHYFVFAAHRLAMLVSEIRRVSPDETISIMGHSQGTLIALLAQALLVDKGQRCADTLVLVDSPYSVLPKVTPKDHDTLATLIRIVSAVTQTPHAQPPLSALRDSKTYGGRSGPRWSPTQGTRPDKIGNFTVFPERDNRGKVYVYFCPDDTTVALDDVQGIGTYGVPDATPDGRPAMTALQSLGFYQRLWTKRHRDGEPVLVGKSPQPEFIRAPGEHRYPGASLLTGVASQAPIAKGQERLINAEALTPPHAPQMFGGEAIKGTPTSAGQDKPDEVAKASRWVKTPQPFCGSGCLPSMTPRTPRNRKRWRVLTDYRKTRRTTLAPYEKARPALAAVLVTSARKPRVRPGHAWSMTRRRGGPTPTTRRSCAARKTSVG